jgi:hypothetical protein
MAISVTLNDGPADFASLWDTYAGRELPPHLQLHDNVITCPTTHERIGQRDHRDVFLVLDGLTGIFHGAKGKTFDDKRIPLNGGAFIGCTFNNCVLEYSGVPDKVILGENRLLGNTHFQFVGPALTTLQFLHTMYHHGLRPYVEPIINGLRQP